MTTPIVSSDLSSRALREALLAPPAPPGAPPPSKHDAPQVDPALLPTAPELLEASPNIRRLCEGYHRTHRHMLTRGRRQKMGLGVLVSGVSIGALMLARSGSLSAQTARDLVMAIGVASLIALAVLCLFWLRDDQRLRSTQGDRLMRALQFNCGLADEQVQAFRRLCQPTTAFFDCYAVWRTEHHEHAGGLAGFFGNLGDSRRRATV